LIAVSSPRNRKHQQETRNPGHLGPPYLASGSHRTRNTTEPRGYHLPCRQSAWAAVYVARVPLKLLLVLGTSNWKLAVEIGVTVSGSHRTSHPMGASIGGAQARTQVQAQAPATTQTTNRLRLPRMHAPKLLNFTGGEQRARHDSKIQRITHSDVSFSLGGNEIRLHAVDEHASNQAQADERMAQQSKLSITPLVSESEATTKGEHPDSGRSARYLTVVNSKATAHRDKVLLIKQK